MQGKLLVLGLLAWSWGKSLAAAEWQQILDRGFLIVGVQENNPPLASRNKSNELVGFEIDLAQELARQLLGSRDKVKLIPLKNTDRLEALWHDRVDMLIAQMTVTGNRSRLVVFSPSYYTDRAVIIYPKTKLLKSLARPQIAVLHQSSNISVLQTELPQARPIGVSSYQEGFTALLQGKIDGMILDGLAARSWLQTHPQIALQTTAHFSSLAVALPQGIQYAELRQKTTKAIEVLKSEQWLTDRVKFWQLNPVEYK
ncbi:MAG: amino acid ABC transporter substrate-binding protein [Cyanobacteria bacterium M5B4]|nr:MAG: amino acid ABC transporter substrate-binding protein [Cyanobacteria bacterium M5B4]